MGTFNDKTLIDQMIKNNGWVDSCMTDRGAPDNPPALKIVEYTNAWGGVCYGVCFPGDDLDRYRASQYVRNPKTIWVRGQGRG